VSPNERQVLWTASASHGLIHVYELSIPALFLLIQTEFAAGDFAMGRVVTLCGLLFGLGALPAGLVVDRFGSKSLLLACLWGASACMVGMALSPSLAWFAVCAGCMGLFLSIYHPAGTALISTSLPLSGRVFATHGMIGNAGVAGSSVIAGALGARYGWRFALGGLAAAGAVVGLLVLALRLPERRAAREGVGSGHWPGFVLLLVAAGFLGMVYRGVTTFLPKFLGGRFAAGASNETAVGGALTTLALLTGLFGMYVAGRLVDRGLRPVSVFLVGTLLQAPFLVALGLLGGLALVPLAMALAFFHFFTQPPGNHMVARFTPPRLRGLGYGVYFLVAFGAGSLGASVGGFVSERVGLDIAFPALAALLVPAVIAVLWLRTRPEPSADPVPGDTIS
jgi:MFS family permease